MSFELVCDEQALEAVAVVVTVVRRVLSRALCGVKKVMRDLERRNGIYGRGEERESYRDRDRN